jgi:futalosine hydrolase
MRILIVAATLKEVAFLETAAQKGRFKNDVLFCITGVGLVPTVFTLTKYLSNDNKFDLILNLGIAGTTNRNLSIGDVLEVENDSFYDWGAEDNANFISVFDLGLLNKNDFPFVNGKLFSTFKSAFPLRKVNSITVQLVHGNSMSIDKLLAREGTTALESMEGAAVFYVSSQYKLPVMQIRSISNYVEPRNRSNWNIELAINNLNTSVLNFLDSI